MQKIEGQFVPHRREMLESPAWQALSLADRRAIDRLEIEYLRSAGKENGNLICTYPDFREANIQRKTIPSAIREVEAVGLVRIERGKGGLGSHKAPSLYRLTYLPTANADPTDEWRKITSMEDAEKKIAAAHAKACKKRKSPAPKMGSGASPQNGVNSRPQNGVRHSQPPKWGQLSRRPSQEGTIPYLSLPPRVGDPADRIRLLFNPPPFRRRRPPLNLTVPERAKDEIADNA